MNKRALFLLLLLILGRVAVVHGAGGEPGHLSQIIVVFKTHFDIGYTDMASNIVQRYRTTMIDQALDVVDQNRDLPVEQQFVWTVSGWPPHKILQDWHVRLQGWVRDSGAQPAPLL